MTFSIEVKRFAVRLYSELKSLRKVAQLAETSHSTISRWKSGVSFYPAVRAKRSVLDEPTILTAVKLYITTHPFATCRNVQTHIWRCLNKHISVELARRAVKVLGFTRKKSRNVVVTKDLREKTQEFVRRRNSFVAEGRQFVSIDETSFGRSGRFPSYGYAPRGRPLTVFRTPTEV